MLDRVAAAIDSQDYRTAAQLLRPLLQATPQDPWVRFYAGRLQEAAGKPAAAEATYRQLLRTAPHPKLTSQIRQALQRVAASQPRSPHPPSGLDANTAALGFLVLAAAPSNHRDGAIAALARTMQVDAYTARMLLPHRGWRLYRVGAIAALDTVGTALRTAGVPVVWSSLSDLQQIQVFQVQTFEQFTPTATVRCYNAQGQLGQLPFAWSEVSQRVAGRLPIFEQVVDRGYRDRLERKEKTQDYSQLCDLHLPQRRCILRLHDSQYDFSQTPLPTAPLASGTLRTRWNHLMETIAALGPQTTLWSEFTPFGETAAEFADPLEQLVPQIQILRTTASFWDNAFELYSRLIFAQAVCA